MAEKLPLWVDWLVALVIAIVVFNLNVTSAGDPLSGVRGNAPQAGAPGISEDARTAFYLAITLAGTVLGTGSMLVAALWRYLPAALLGVRSFGFLSAAGMAGLLLDYVDGPVRTVQLLVYVAVALASLRFTRLATALASSRHEEMWVEEAAEG
jgi:hypothetical protein